MRWLYTLDVKDDWHRAKRREINARELARIVADKAAALMGRMVTVGPIGHLRDELEELQDEFDSASKDAGLTFDHFDDIWHRLYDWADTPIREGEKICWVKTI